MSVHTRPRAQDPNISMRLIEKIKHKCQDYYRDPPASYSEAYLNDLVSDIMQFKKDCLVAVELAQQFIEKTIENTPKATNKSEILKLECEIERLNQINSDLSQQLLHKEEVKKQPAEDLLDNLPEFVQTDELENVVSDLQAQLVIQELKYENTISDLEGFNAKLKERNEKLEVALKENEKKVEMLEKKVKDSLSGYSKFLVRKITESKEAQTGPALMSIEVGTGVEVQRSNEFMSQISRLSITESEIFDVTSMQVCEVFHQSDMMIKPAKCHIGLEKFEGVRVYRDLSFESVGLGVEGMKKVRELVIELLGELSINSIPPPKPIISSLDNFSNTASPALSSSTSAMWLPAPIKTLKNLTQFSSPSLSFLPQAPKPLPPASFSLQTFSLFNNPQAPMPTLESYPQPSLKQHLSVSSNSNLFIKPQPFPLSLHSFQSARTGSSFSFSSSSSLSFQAPSSISLSTQASKPVLSLHLFQYKANPAALSTLPASTLSLPAAAPVEESKARSSKRRGSQLSDRKPAIEEFFSLVIFTQTFQAAKMKIGQVNKAITPEDLFQKANSENIPFFEWNDWVAKQLKP